MTPPAAFPVFASKARPNRTGSGFVAPSVARPPAAGGFRDVKVGLVRDDAPAPVRAEAVRRIREIIRLQHELTGRDVVVVPVLISTGRISREKFPTDLAGLPVRYSGEALLPHPGLATWIEARVRETRRVARTGR